MQDELNQFEDKLMNGVPPEIKYSMDRDIEASVRQAFLSEKYGKDSLDAALMTVQRGFLDLWEPEVFSQVVEILDQPK
jgi:hypothetical protein